MLRWIMLAVTVVLLTAAATFVFDSTANTTDVAPTPVVVHDGPQPKVEVIGKPLFDFGTLPKHTQSVHTWQLKNTGEANLLVWLDATTCSCTVASLSKDSEVKDSSGKPKVTVKPGQTTAIDVSFDTKEWTTFDQKATLGTNDPAEPLVALAIKGKVTPPIVIYPPQTIEFRSISNEEKQTSRIAVYSPDRPEIKILKITTSRPDLIVTNVTAMAPKELQTLSIKAGYTVTVDIKPGMPIGRFWEELAIHTDHPKQSEIKVSISGECTGPISVVPNRLRMPAVTTDKGGTGQVFLLVRSGKPTHFEVMRKPDKVLVAVAPDDSSAQKGRYRMTVTVPPGTSPGVVEGQIIIKTDHTNAPELKVPISVFVTRNAG